MSAGGGQNFELASQIVAYELRAPAAEGNVAAGIESAFRRLHGALSPIVGSGGYRAFLVRAIDLASRERGHEWVGALRSSTPFFGVAQVAEQANVVGAEAAIRGACVLLATLLDLLCAFIGEDLTVRNVRGVWTEVAVGERSSAIASKETK